MPTLDIKRNQSIGSHIPTVPSREAPAPPRRSLPTDDWKLMLEESFSTTHA